MNSNAFAERLAQGNLELTRPIINTLQVNIGKLCNQACHHCHVEAGPKHPDNMVLATVDRILELLAQSPQITTVDITGGAPELNPHFRHFVKSIRALGMTVIDRCNLTVLFEPNQEGTAQFLADNSVEVAASLPCYTPENVDAQRGQDVFAKSIKGLQLLNSLGYGKEGTGLSLNLVYNPAGNFLPPNQQALETEYKQRLMEDFGIHFNQLFTITNMPIKRYLHSLHRELAYADYMKLLLDAFNPSAVDNVMCTELVSIGFNGEIYDCDFNQMLEMPLQGERQTVFSIDRLEDLTQEITIANHCFGCTAGAGSSCSGTLL